MTGHTRAIENPLSLPCAYFPKYGLTFSLMISSFLSIYHNYIQLKMNMLTFPFSAKHTSKVLTVDLLIFMNTYECHTVYSPTLMSPIVYLPSLSFNILATIYKAKTMSLPLSNKRRWRCDPQEGYNPATLPLSLTNKVSLFNTDWNPVLYQVQTFQFHFLNFKFLSPARVPLLDSNPSYRL